MSVLMRKIITVMVIVFIALISDNTCRANERTKRFLVYPEAAPTRVQIISGFGVPVDLNYESLTMGYVFKANYYLPDNVTNYIDVLGDPFDRTTIPISGGKRRRRRMVDVTHLQDNYIKSERYTVEATELAAELNDGNEVSGAAYNWYDEKDEDDGNIKFEAADLQDDLPQNLEQSRFTLYKGIEKMAEVSGLPGRPCMLRSICETAEVPFSYGNGILGELAHLILTPSSTNDQLSDHSDNEYLRAEQLGKTGAPCKIIFRECTTSLLERFSGIYETLNLMG